MTNHNKIGIYIIWTIHENKMNKDMKYTNQIQFMIENLGKWNEVNKSLMQGCKISN
jgi:hypothetical protein